MRAKGLCTIRRACELLSLLYLNWTMEPPSLLICTLSVLTQRSVHVSDPRGSPGFLPARLEV